MKCTFDDVFSLFEDGQVNAKYVNRATCMHLQGLDNNRAKMHPTWSYVKIKATYINRIPSGGVSYAPFRHFVLLEKYIVYGQGPIA